MLIFRVVCGGCLRRGAVWLVVVCLMCGGGGSLSVVGVVGGVGEAWPLVVSVPAGGGLGSLGPAWGVVEWRSLPFLGDTHLFGLRALALCARRKYKDK